MQPLYTEQEFLTSKSTNLLPCKCYCCNNKFLISKKLITHELKNKRGRIKFCSQKCHWTFNKPPILTFKVNCKKCGKEFIKKNAEIKKTKNNFCSRSCAGYYNNAHKKHGYRRSKLEIWLETQLLDSYPDLEFHFNRKDTINSELDIYIPSLKLAFELNGLFHYEPIFGESKLSQIQNNDERKFQACLEKGIELCLIDVSSIKYFKPEKAKKYLDGIRKIVDNHFISHLKFC